MKTRLNKMTNGRNGDAKSTKESAFPTLPSVVLIAKSESACGCELSQARPAFCFYGPLNF